MPSAEPGNVGNDAEITEFPSLLMVGLIDRSPHASTNTTSRRYGTQAMNTWLPVCLGLVVATG